MVFAAWAKRKAFLFSIILSISLIVLSACGLEKASYGLENAEPAHGTPVSTDNLVVNFLDVGQADSILIRQGAYAMLIDAGNNADSDFVVNYLKDKDVETLDYVIGTHPHEDHIGGLDAVIEKFSIKDIIMPKVGSNTKTFEDVLNAIRDKNMKITAPIPGTEYTFGDSKFTVLAPASESYDEINNYSVVIKLVYGNTSFLFTGDAESVSEDEMLAKGYDLKADVLKVGHHGSSTSTTDAFLAAVSPRYAIISVGKDNDYGHPAAGTLKKLENAGTTTYRTDMNGTITAESDGKTVTITTGKEKGNP